jgi:hypothetical protein
MHFRGFSAAVGVPSWITHVQVAIGGQVTFGRFIGKGFFMVKTFDTEMVCRLLLFSPFRSPTGLCIVPALGPRF